MTSPIKLGSAKTDITPAKPVPLAGFAHRQGPFEHIARPLFARIHAFERTDGSGHTASALLVSADLIWWGSDLVEKLVPKIKERWGFHTVLLHATHTHCGPQTSGRFTDALGRPDAEYIADLEQRLFEGIGRALRTMEPVTIERGAGQCRIGVNRRKNVGGKIAMAPDVNGPVDPAVTVIRFRASGGAVKALFVHYTCHPTTTGDNEISSEYCGAALERIEQALGGGAVGAFLQGCCGDIRPALVSGGEFYRGCRMEVERFGSWLSEEVLRVSSLPMRQLAPAGLGSRTVELPLPFESVPASEELEAEARQTDIYGERARLLLREPQCRQESIPLEITRLDLAEELSLVAFNAEMVADYGRFVKEASFGKALPLGYTNGMIGYVPTEEQLVQGGYEARDSVPYFGLPSPFHPRTEGVIRSAILQVIGEKPNHE
ncbi:neutral/alkaline non-lysosomal ceramidase N-terminal domain-containing protein [Paenibacillus doosanensis]|uniref:neutral/alkaline non-lysosomal ceramidase N-terminal domain-containing protein n=1 Tax=Paenibacillus doosanensis TaxID=1229154 RepID=UPI0021804504|nr:neutral/alkaline non-lysosomal ceramidase N-terminal domain-containing protein [Paenibacillus doosanensis]MCS7460978.1 neutral/alkaline non-lysosomal ceramidase N-terminal domain-containing protein [Paenibacillus doosanensis]